MDSINQYNGGGKLYLILPTTPPRRRTLLLLEVQQKTSVVTTPLTMMTPSHPQLNPLENQKSVNVLWITTTTNPIPLLQNLDAQFTHHKTGTYTKLSRKYHHVTLTGKKPDLKEIQFLIDKDIFEAIPPITKQREKKYFVPVGLIHSKKMTRNTQYIRVAVVVMGNFQVAGDSYEVGKTSSPVADLLSIRLLIALATELGYFC